MPRESSPILEPDQNSNQAGIVLPLCCKTHHLSESENETIKSSQFSAGALFLSMLVAWLSLAPATSA